MMFAGSCQSVPSFWVRAARAKTVLLQNLILDVYKDCFSRISVFSLGIEVNTTWGPVNNYVEINMKVRHTT